MNGFKGASVGSCGGGCSCGGGGCDSCGGGFNGIEWPTSCPNPYYNATGYWDPYWPFGSSCGPWPGYGAPWYGGYGGYGAGQRAQAQAQKIENNYYFPAPGVRGDGGVSMDGAGVAGGSGAGIGACGGGMPMMMGPLQYGPPGAGVGACGGGAPMMMGPLQYGPQGAGVAGGAGGASVGFDLNMNIAPGWGLRIDPYKGNDNVILAMTLDTPYGPVEAVGKMSEATFATMLREGKARLAPRIQKWIERMMRPNGAVMSPSSVPATPSTPSVEILDVDVSRLQPPPALAAYAPPAAGAGVGASVGQDASWGVWDDTFDGPVQDEMWPSYQWPTYPLYVHPRRRWRRRPWWLRRNWYWWLGPYSGWYNPYYPGNFPYGPYYLNGRWVYGPPQLQGASYSVNGQPVTGSGQPIGSNSPGASSAGVGAFFFARHKA